MKNRFSECPVCCFQITLESDVEESELISCPDCQSRLVVAEINNPKIILEEAPEIEEDWGE